MTAGVGSDPVVMVVLDNQAAKQPEKLKELTALYEQWTKLSGQVSCRGTKCRR